MSDFAAKKQKLIAQLKAEGIRDSKVLEAMQKIDRHLFVDENLHNSAYENKPLPIEFEQTISQPYIVAYMTQNLDLKGGEKVLEIGTGSGYQAAILAEICGEVYSIEALPALAEKSENLLQNLGYKNINIKADISNEAWIDKAPFDAIIVTAAAKKIPQILVKQLKINGKLVIPVEENNVQILMKITKTDEDSYKAQKLLAVRFVPMIER